MYKVPYWRGRLGTSSFAENVQWTWYRPKWFFFWRYHCNAENVQWNEYHWWKLYFFLMIFGVLFALCCVKVWSFVVVFFFAFAFVLCVLCRDVVVGCGGLLRSVCCKRLLNVVVEATKAALDNWLTIMTMRLLVVGGSCEACAVDCW